MMTNQINIAEVLPQEFAQIIWLCHF